MTSGNNITLVGNIVSDPVLRFVPSGQATTSFSVAVNRRWQNSQTQEWTEATSFFDCVCWNALAEHVADSLHRGDRAIISGRLDQRSWTTPEGDKRSKVELTADEIGPSLRWATADIRKAERREPVTAGATGGSPGPAEDGQDEPF
jgi:single-strand DNA-binding protein